MDRRRFRYPYGDLDAEFLRLLYDPPPAEYVPLCDPARLGACPGCEAESGEAACAVCAGRATAVDEPEPD